MSSLRFGLEVRRLGLVREETIIGGTIDIQIFSPAGKCFDTGLHVLVTNWHSNFADARMNALVDAKRHLPLQDCPQCCECRDAS